MKIELSDYLKSSCSLSHPDGLFIGIYNATNGKPCDGCGYKPNCKARHDIELASKQKAGGQKKYVGETNQQIADRLGASKRQVAKMRKAGQL